ncbi:uncharacterized protein TNIN_51211 [Trichonephila inaurata madagascariensis]|uniref:Secreted protein n=1 Tax=Trichonephila inaurata madagascariensis TaxID=2747483 RepID=A0A8X6IL96_9ARAC|nr:uncharacterized protein TNIN_51211 [Trichonephila inaurata madagascariensis]
MFSKVCVLGLVLCCLVVASRQVVKYKYFDEYLLHLEKRQQTILVEEVEIKVASPLLIRTGVVRSKEEQCCVLGQMAGEKGYHCFSHFYAARILYRNYNRVHNKKIPALLKGKPNPTADKLMRTFGQCVAHRGAIFHKCCRHAALMST